MTKAARSRIILEAAAACHQNVNGNRKRKADALLGPKTIIRHALIEMFGRAQLAEASACGSHGKKAIRKHVLQALYREYNFNFSIINLFFIILALLNHEITHQKLLLLLYCKKLMYIFNFQSK